MTPRLIARKHGAVAVISDDHCSLTHFVFAHLQESSPGDAFMDQLLEFHGSRIDDASHEHREISPGQFSHVITVTWR